MIRLPLPAELRKIGVQAVGKVAYELADGTLQQYEFGLARIEFMGEVTAGRVLFGPDDVEPLLGVTALESVGIAVDPTNRTVKRWPRHSPQVEQRRPRPRARTGQGPGDAAYRDEVSEASPREPAGRPVP